MNSILIEIIMSNQCNKRCPYCDLNFYNQSFSRTSLDIFSDFLDKNRSKVKYFHINFFWWEPLLSFDDIVYIVEKQSHYQNKYSLWTNGLLLTKRHLDFFRKNSFHIFLSIDNITGFDKFDLLAWYEDIISINFINDPDHMENSKKIFELIDAHRFAKIHFMPVYSSKDWNTDSLRVLLEMKKYISSNTNNNIECFSYFNGVSVDTQFVLDTDLYFYKDIDSLLWLQKQYKRLPGFLREKIDRLSRSWKLTKDLSIDELLSTYDISTVMNLVTSIPKYINTHKQNLIINKILQYDQ